MQLIIECVILCGIFTLLILPPLFRNPLSQIVSYPPAIRKRVESLPQYKDILEETAKNNILRKITVSVAVVFLLAVLTYLLGKTDFASAFKHVFVLFSAVNLYDLVVLDLIIFPNSRKVIIPGTEDMAKEYKNPVHHIKGACIGVVISIIAALVVGGVVEIISLVVK